MSTNLFKETLKGQGISSGTELAHAMNSPAMILFFGSTQTSRAHAELWTWDDRRDREVSKHFPRLRLTMSATRKATVQAAQDEAREKLGLGEWAKSPFDNCWLPQEVLSAARKRFVETAPTG